MRKALGLLLIVAVLVLVWGCATGEKVRASVREGMSKAEVIQVLGNPDGFRRAGAFEALMYTNRLISGWSWDRTDYTVILQDGRVVEYGSGDVRRNTPNTLILVPIR